MQTAPQLPNPRGEHAGRNLSEAKPANSFANRAKRWTPLGAENEPPVATAARVALKLVTSTGEAKTAEELGSSGTVRYDAAQTPLDATQLAQFLDNLGRDGSDVLDLGLTVLKADEFQGSRLSDPLNNAVDLLNGILEDFASQPSVDWASRELVGHEGTTVASWGFDTLNYMAWFDVNGEYRVNGTPGYTGTHNVAVGDTIEITGGIITNYEEYAPL